MMKSIELNEYTYAAAFILEIELGCTGDIREEIDNDLKHCYMTIHQTSKGETVHYYDGMKEGIAYTEDGETVILLDDEAEEFCKEERIYIVEE